MRCRFIPNNNLQRFQWMMVIIFISVSMAFSGCSNKPESQTSANQSEQPESQNIINPSNTNTAEISPSGEPPKISFKETTKDFGKVRQGEELKTEFSFTNTGKGELLIEKVKAG